MSLNVGSVQSQSYMGFGSKITMEKQLKNAGIPEDVIAQGTTAVEKYASEHSISLPQTSVMPQANTKENVKPDGAGQKFDEMA